MRGLVAPKSAGLREWMAFTAWMAAIVRHGIGNLIAGQNGRSRQQLTAHIVTASGQVRGTPRRVLLGRLHGSQRFDDCGIGKGSWR